MLIYTYIYASTLYSKRLEDVSNFCPLQTALQEMKLYCKDTSLVNAIYICDDDSDDDNDYDEIDRSIAHFSFN